MRQLCLHKRKRWETSSSSAFPKWCKVNHVSGIEQRKDCAGSKRCRQIFILIRFSSESLEHVPGRLQHRGRVPHGQTGQIAQVGPAALCQRVVEGSGTSKYIYISSIIIRDGQICKMHKNAYFTYSELFCIFQNFLYFLHFFNILHQKTAKIAKFCPFWVGSWEEPRLLGDFLFARFANFLFSGQICLYLMWIFWSAT